MYLLSPFRLPLKSDVKLLTERVQGESAMGDKANPLIELAKLAASRHDERRKYEWKVSFAFWGLIIGAIAKKNSLPQVSPAIGVSIIILYAFFWLRAIWVANENDKRQSRHFVGEASSSLMNPDHILTAPPPKIGCSSWLFWIGFLRDWAMLFHLLVTTAIVLAFFLIK